MNLMKIVGIAETLSTILLFFVAVPMKHLGDDPSMVSLVGPIHGGLFMGWCFLLWLAQRRGEMDMNTALKGMALAIPPGGPIWFDLRVNAPDEE